MKDLGDLIKNNKAFFDNSEPQNGHFERFEAKLKAESKKKRFLPKTIVFLRVASIAILVVLSSLWLLERFEDTKKDISIALGEISPEYKEVEFYYTRLYDSKIEEFNKVKEIDPELEAELLKNEFQELDSIYKALQKELGANKEDERIINAMIGYYQTKIEILNQIIFQLNNVKEINESEQKDKIDQTQI